MFGLGMMAASMNAQYLKSGQIEVGNTGAKFRISDWNTTGGVGKYTDDDNFFISRVKPRARFYNAATQVNKNLKPWWTFKGPSGSKTEEYGVNYSKKLLMWTPIGSREGVNSPYTIIPDGLYNEEMFTMWQYVTTWGAWNCAFMRVPGNFVDVAHKNGVAVTTQASPSYASRLDGYNSNGVYDENRDWLSVFKDMNTNSSEVLSYLDWYGYDGIGYNSEWSPVLDNGEFDIVENLNNVIAKHFDARYKNKDLPSFSSENIWYDGERYMYASWDWDYDNGKYKYIKHYAQSFDNGLDAYGTGTTSEFFGDSTATANNKKTSFFYNYNWNCNYASGGNVGRDYIDKSVTKAISMGRNPFDLYAGFNLQAKEPSLVGSEKGTWPFIEKKAVSIGLWSGHDTNMFWESRNSKGSNPETAQTTYQKGLERWFTNSNGNPAQGSDLEISNSMSSDLRHKFFGMSRFVAAQSTLGWDLTEEPFVTFFNVGNGKFFNWKGQTTKKRTLRDEWSNIGIQDYLPTWRWWWSDGLLGGSGTAPTGLTAAFAWNAAWFGGSSLRITGSCSGDAVLNLFKTDFKIHAGDTIKVSYLLNNNGSTKMTLLLGDTNGRLGSDHDAIDTKSDMAKIGSWNTDNFVVEKDMDLGVIALKFSGASNLDMNIGQLMIKRPKGKNNYGLETFGNDDVSGQVGATNHAIDIVKCEHLGTSMHGIDAKVVFRLGENSDNLAGHYNIDHKVSMFNLYTKIRYLDANGKDLVEPEVTLMGSTTSWAGLVFKSPYDVELGEKAAKVTLNMGVSAVALDMATESEIKWSSTAIDVKNSGAGYTVSEDVGVSSDFIVNGDTFTAGYKDPNHNGAWWVLRGPAVGTNAYVTEEQYINVGYGKTFDATASEDETYRTDDIKKDNLPYGFYDLVAFDSKEKADAAVKNKSIDGNVKQLSAYIQIYKSETGKPKITKFVALDDDKGDDISEVTEETAKNTNFATLRKNAAGRWNYHFEWGDTHRDLEDDGLTTLPGAGIKVRPNMPLTMKYEALSNMLGSVSKGVAVEDMALGVKASDLGMVKTGNNTDQSFKQSFTVAYWINFKRINDKTSFLLNVRNPEEEAWPNRAWGWLWSTMDQNGNFSQVTVRTGVESGQKNFNYNDVKFELGAWYHMAFVIDADNNEVRFYRNGQLMSSTVAGDTKNSFLDFNKGKIAGTGAGTFTGSNTIMLGGTAGKGSVTGFDAVVDNFQIYNRALDDGGIKVTMGDIVKDDNDANGLSAMSMSDLEKNYGLVGFWDFENDYADGYENEVTQYKSAKLLRFNYPVDNGDNDVQEKDVADEASVSVGFPALNEGVSQQSVTENYTVAGAKSYKLMPDGYTNDGTEVAGDTHELSVVSELDEAAPVMVKKLRSSLEGDKYVGYAQFTFPDYNKKTSNGYTDITMSVYVAKLTLSNVVGSDVATYKYIYVLDWDKPITTAVDNVKGNELSIMPMKNGAIFTCAEDVKVNVFDLSGRLVKHFTLNGSEFVPLAAGVYIANGKKIMVR